MFQAPGSISKILRYKIKPSVQKVHNPVQEREKNYADEASGFVELTSHQMSFFLVYINYHWNSPVMEILL